MITKSVRSRPACGRTVEDESRYPVASASLAQSGPGPGSTWSTRPLKDMDPCLWSATPRELTGRDTCAVGETTTLRCRPWPFRSGGLQQAPAVDRELGKRDSAAHSPKLQFRVALPDRKDHRYLLRRAHGGHGLGGRPPPSVLANGMISDPPELGACWSDDRSDHVE